MNTDACARLSDSTDLCSQYKNCTYARERKSEADCLRVSGTEQSASRYLPLQTLAAANLNLKSEANVETLKKAHWPHSIAE